MHSFMFFTIGIPKYDELYQTLLISRLCFLMTHYTSYFHASLGFHINLFKPILT